MSQSAPVSWVLDGYPHTVSQAESLLVHGVCPTTLVLVHGPEHHATAEHYEKWLEKGKWEGACSDLEALQQWARRSRMEVIVVADHGEVEPSSRRHPVSSPTPAPAPDVECRHTSSSTRCGDKPRCD